MMANNSEVDFSVRRALGALSALLSFLKFASKFGVEKLITLASAGVR